jgi:hypothetical protein
MEGPSRPNVAQRQCAMLHWVCAHARVCVCVCVYVYVWARICVHACVCVCVHDCSGMYFHVCSVSRDTHTIVPGGCLYVHVYVYANVSLLDLFHILFG